VLVAEIGPFYVAKGGPFLVAKIGILYLTIYILHIHKASTNKITDPPPFLKEQESGIHGGAALLLRLPF